MEKIYRARRDLQRQSHRFTIQRFGWGVVCVVIAAVLAGLWIQVQSLTNQNNTLRQQLAQAASSSPTCSVTGTWRAGESKEESVTVDGLKRSYYVHLPGDFRDGAYYPLLMFYVGRGSDAHGAELAYGLDKLPAIVIYPVPTIGGQDMTAWQGAPYSSGADDIAFTSDILDSVQSDLCIDRNHIYAAGMSNGGGFVSLLSCELPGRFAAYGVVSGAMYPPESTCAPLQPAPLISIHGDQDRTVPYDGSLTRQLPAVETWVATRATDNECSKNPTTTYPTGNTVQTTWNGCKDGATVENVRVQGVGHVWGAVSDGFIWQFLSRFSL